MTATASPVAGSRYEFDAEFQTKIAALALRDTKFNQLTDGLLRPEYMESEVEGSIVALALDYFGKYKSCPGSTAVISMLLKDAQAKKAIRSDLFRDVATKVKELLSVDLSDREYVIEKVVAFARHQAMAAAVLASAELLDDTKLGDARFDRIDKLFTQAKLVGLTQDDTRYDFWEMAAARKQRRHDEMAGIIKKTGITTGFKEIDELLYHRGWGRKELTVLMGPAKSGKSMTLVTFGALASVVGQKNVLFVTLEVSQDIIADRLDANMSNTSMADLQTHMSLVESRIRNMRDTGAGNFIIHGYPSGSFRPKDLRRLLHRYRAQGVTFDLIIVDYADLMAPDVLSKEPIENSRTIYIDLRAIAQEEDAAMMSATQTNREGFRAQVGKMEHVASDINKVRTVDLLISLNQTEDEKARGEARLFFAASRNQAGGKNVRVRCALDKASYIESVLGIE